MSHQPIPTGLPTPALANSPAKGDSVSVQVVYSDTMRILIIEDDRDAADYIVRAFRETGHIADHAADGEEGLAMALDDARKDNKRTVLMRVKSGDNTRFVALPAGRA